MEYLENLKKAIKKSGLKRKYIAKELDINYDTFRRKLKGDSDFKVEELLKLCEIIKIDIKEIFQNE
jgi:DNA-binding XRE family transcriptional regulator